MQSTIQEVAIMVPMSERLMFQAELLLAHGELIEVVFLSGSFRHTCRLNSRGTSTDAQDCSLTSYATGKSAIVPFSTVMLSDGMANRLERMAQEADREVRYNRHLANSGGSRQFWRGLRGAA